MGLVLINLLSKHQIVKAFLPTKDNGIVVLNIAPLSLSIVFLCYRRRNKKRGLSFRVSKTAGAKKREIPSA